MKINFKNQNTKLFTGLLWYECPVYSVSSLCPELIWSYFMYVCFCWCFLFSCFVSFKKYYCLSTTDTFPDKGPYFYNSGNFALLAPASMWLASSVILLSSTLSKCDLPSLPPHALQKPTLSLTACMELTPIAAATCHQSSLYSLSACLGLIFTITI